MDNFDGKLAVITGAGSGIGRELAVALSRYGARLALLDINEPSVEETANRCRQSAGGAVSTHQCDVTDAAAVESVASQVAEAHDSSHVNLLVNNAGIGSTESFLDGDPNVWERTFDICWGGVYHCSRSFLPMVVTAEEGHIVNISSINGLWASLGPSRTHTSYCAAKFAVRGFTEALITEMRLLAPHVGVSVVMPGHIGTDLVANSNATLGRPWTGEVTEAQAAFRNAAPTTPAEAAQIILNGVRAGRWRILIGHDAHVLDEAIRADPEGAYEPGFVDFLHEQGILVGLVQ